MTGSPARPIPRALLAAHLAALLALGGASAGCSEDHPRPLTPGQLNDDETLYVTRIVVLERVKALLLTSPGRGAAAGDSLVAAWGDSALSLTTAAAPSDPGRAERVHDLLLRLLAAEHDSLLRCDGLRPLSAPLPTPADSVPGAGFPASTRIRDDG